jgi:gas vesicle protein
MAYEYDRMEREDGGGGSFLMGLLAGTVLGAGLGMLFAPKAGNELRNQLSESAGRLRTTANDSYQQASERVTEKVSQLVDRGKEAYDRARTSVAGSGPGTSGNTGASAMPSQPSGPLSGTSVGTGGYPNNRG